MELPSIHDVTKLTCVCRICFSQIIALQEGELNCLWRIILTNIHIDKGHLCARVTGTLTRLFVPWSSLEGQQDFPGGSRVKDRVTFWDWDVHELRWTPRSS